MTRSTVPEFFIPFDCYNNTVKLSWRELQKVSLLTDRVTALQVLVPADAHGVEGGVLGQGGSAGPGEADGIVWLANDDLEVKFFAALEMVE